MSLSFQVLVVYATVANNLFGNLRLQFSPAFSSDMYHTLTSFYIYSESDINYKLVPMKNCPLETFIRAKKEFHRFKN
jgi:hypothetical protein